MTLDIHGLPLVWKHPDATGEYVDAWNGVYDTHVDAEAYAANGDESRRVLGHGERPVFREPHLV